jgi:hypothetical protein
VRTLLQKTLLEGQPWYSLSQRLVISLQLFPAGLALDRVPPTAGPGCLCAGHSSSDLQAGRLGCGLLPSVLVSVFFLAKVKNLKGLAA